MEPEVVSLWGFLALALGGSAHCAGMCGGLALAAVGVERKMGSGLILFVFGKALGYAILGAALASSTLGVSGALNAGWMRPSLALLTGGVLVYQGLSGLSLVPGGGWGSRGGSQRSAGWTRWLVALHQGVAQIGGNLGRFCLGMTAALMPCGLSLGAILMAGSLQPLEAAAGLLVFGLATGPGVSAVPLGTRLFKRRGGKGWLRLMALTLILVGAFTVVRGLGPLVGGAFQEALPECCEL